MRAAVYDGFRYLLAVAFLQYGYAKLSGAQFYTGPWGPQATVDGLSGQELVWAFYGRSRGLVCCIGAAQIAAAVLLLWRRTAPLGAALYLPVIANIALIDHFFEVRVGASAIGVALLAGNLALFALDGGRALAAVRALVGQPPDCRQWRQTIAGLAAGVLLVLVVWYGSDWLDRVLSPEPVAAPDTGGM